jgi:hypothetical protein
MLIRYGYEITLTCTQPTALVCLLSVHEDRADEIRVPETTFTTPDVPVSTYRDLFGNRCRRLVAPAGDLMIWGDATIEDDGKLDPVVPEARETPVPDLPDDCLGYLMGSRYCETDRLSEIAWDTFERFRPVGAGCRPSATSCKPIFVSTICKLARHARRSTPSMSVSGSAATSRIWRSPSAAASTSLHVM